MALQECGLVNGLNLGRGLKELQPHGSLEFPCAGYASCYTDRQEDIIPWHWHEEMEIMYVKNGQMEVKIPSKSFFLEKGDCLVINSNELHYGAAVVECELYSFVFSPAFIAGNESFVFAKKYIQPLLACNDFCGYYVKAGSNENVAHWFTTAFEAIAGDCCGYEFIVREMISRICVFLYKEFDLQTDLQNIPLNQDNLRIRKMLEFIHENFSNDISLPEIAAVADIGERECLRCFQKTIQISPIQYLLKYRIMQGAEMLSGNPADSISEIAALCGFDSPSNFSKTFKHFYGCTPREYRKRNIK